LQVSWTAVIKPYAQAVIAEIRAIDPDNIIIVGTPTWSQDVDVAAQSPIIGSNIAYTLHFYAATHKQSLRNKATVALGKGLALWVTEFGTCESSGSGVLDYTESQRWFDFMDTNLISWCNWAVDDKAETSAALKPNVSATGGWQDSDLSESGILVRDKIIACNGTLTAVQEPAVASGASDYRLARNYPNPFNSSTIIEFSLASSQRVKLEVFNEAGQTAALLVDERMSMGIHRIDFRGDRLPGGEYIYRIQTEKDVLTGRMQLVK
jgi:endoglucanase